MALSDTRGNTRVITPIAPDTVNQAGTRAAREVGSVTTGTVFGVEFRDGAAITRRVLLCVTGDRCEAQAYGNREIQTPHLLVTVYLGGKRSHVTSHPFMRDGCFPLPQTLRLHPRTA